MTVRCGIAGSEQQAMQEVMSASSFLSNNDSRLHFGLAGNDRADVTIRWPNGAQASFRGLAANQLHTLREGQQQVVSGPLRTS